MMAAVAKAGAGDIRIRNIALNVTQGLKQKDFRGEACACLEYVRDRIRYVRDIRSIETLQYPVVTITQNGGDCDDKAILLASLLLSIGHKVRFIAIAMLPGVYSHVWLQAFIYGRWVDLEPTEPLECGERVPSEGAVSHMVREIR